MASTRSSTTASQARKKRKMESDKSDESLVSQQSAPLPRHEKFWLEDGNVFIVSLDGVEFKLHASLLSYRSPRLKELIATARERVSSDGALAQIVKLDLDDRSENLAALFEVLFGTSTWLDRQTKIQFSIFRSVTLLAVKYQVQDLINSAVLCLRAAFPATSLHDFDKSDLNDPIIIQNKDFPAVLSLARACDALDVLPLAFYRCATLFHEEFKEIVTGVVYGDDVVQLSPEDIKMLYLGQLQLRKLSGNVTKVLLEANAGKFRGAECATPARCTASLQNILLKCSTDCLFEDTECLGSILADLESWSRKSSINYRLCGSCKKTMRDAEDVRRAEAFGQLGKIFGVGDWPRVPSA